MGLRGLVNLGSARIKPKEPKVANISKQSPEVVSEKSSKGQFDHLSDMQKSELIEILKAKLSQFGKGERAEKEAKRIRRNLRKLGYYISKQGSVAGKTFEELKEQFSK